MKSFDYFIDVRPLHPPIGDKRFVAKFSYFYEVGNGPDKAVMPPVSEAWGHTEDEARRKLESSVEAWQNADG